MKITRTDTWIVSVRTRRPKARARGQRAYMTNRALTVVLRVRDDASLLSFAGGGMDHGMGAYGAGASLGVASPEAAAGAAG